MVRPSQESVNGDWVLHALELPGAFLIDPIRHPDPLGFSIAAWSRSAFDEISFGQPRLLCRSVCTSEIGVVRGLHLDRRCMHLVRCTRGAVYAILADLRPQSPTYCRWRGFELSAENQRMIYLPAGFAGGYQALDRDSEIADDIYGEGPEEIEHIPYDDSRLELRWPLEVTGSLRPGNGRSDASLELAEMQFRKESAG